jgi:hypothetical protein
MGAKKQHGDFLEKGSNNFIKIQRYMETTALNKTAQSAPSRKQRYVH